MFHIEQFYLVNHLHIPEKTCWNSQENANPSSKGSAEKENPSGIEIVELGIEFLIIPLKIIIKSTMYHVLCWALNAQWWIKKDKTKFLT